MMSFVAGQALVVQAKAFMRPEMRIELSIDPGKRNLRLRLICQ